MVDPTSTSTMLQLPVAASVDGTEYAWINQGGTDRRTTLSAIANTATGFLPDTIRINTPGPGGLSGGGLLTSDLTLTFAPANLDVKTAMVIADTFAINDSVTSDPRQITFPNAMKALTGLSALAIPSATDDYLIINRASDGDTYKVNPQALGLGTGNVPVGGTTGQPLVKNSSTNFDSAWQTLPVIGGGTGQITNTDHGILLGQGASAVVATAAMTDGQLLIGQTSADPAPTTVTGDVTISNLGVTAIGLNKVTDAMLRQSAGLSVIGRSAATTGDVADLVGTADQILRVAAAGASLGFGSIDLSKSAAVGSSILGATNGGTGLSSYTLGDIIYSSAADTLSALPGNTTSGIQYLSQTGTGVASAAPAWASISGGDITGAALTKVDDTNITLTLGGSPSTALLRATSITAGWTGQLAVSRGGTGDGSFTAYSVICGGTISTGPLQNVSGVGTAGQYLISQGASALPAWASGPSAGPLVQVTTSSAAISAGTVAVAVVRTSPATTALSLPPVASQGNTPIHIFDWSSSVTDHVITITPDGSETIMLLASYPIASNSSSLAGVTLWPSADLSGWYIAP